MKMILIIAIILIMSAYVMFAVNADQKEKKQ